MQSSIQNSPIQNSRIHKLSPLLINQLSAGEVVTRPASVVKELLENAIDAGADKITISITQGGMGLIEVSDNGSGIHPDDMLMAVTRHATSKVADVEHLHGICTLGFRGEALASISAVSRLTLTSSHDNSGVGRCLSVAGQIDQPDITPVVCPQGTTVTVRDLYFNVPARRGNLKSIATEYAHIEAVVCHVALVYANIQLQLYHEGKCRLNLPAYSPASVGNGVTNNNINNNAKNDATSSGELDNGLPLTRIKQAISSPLPERAYPLFVDLSVLMPNSNSSCSTQNAIQGWIWLADELFISDLRDDNLLDDGFYRQKTTSHELPKLLYINNRLVKDNAINLQIRQALQSLNIANHQAGYALFFTLPNDWLNVNVHPTKQRISIHALANINAHLKNGIQQLLQPVLENIHAKNINTQNITNENNENSNIEQGNIKNPQYAQSVPSKIDTYQSQSTDYQYPTKANDSLYANNSHVSSAKTLYQLDNQDTPVDKQNPALKQSGQASQQYIHQHSQKYKLTIISEQQKNKQKAEKLAKVICETLAIEDADAKITPNILINKYHKLENSYKIEIVMDVVHDCANDCAVYQEMNQGMGMSMDSDMNGGIDSGMNPIEQMIALSDSICSPWTVFYQRESRQIELIFNKNEACRLRNPHFNVIHWASFQLLTAVNRSVS